MITDVGDECNYQAHHAGDSDNDAFSVTGVDESKPVSHALARLRHNVGRDAAQ